MLPRWTNTRKKRDIKSLKLTWSNPAPDWPRPGAVVDCDVRRRRITIDCDVSADGTRCASVTGHVALYLACRELLDEGVSRKCRSRLRFRRFRSAFFEDEAVSRPQLRRGQPRHRWNCNVVMTSKGEFIEVQGTGEGRPFTQNELHQLLALGEQGCTRLRNPARNARSEETPI